MSDFTTICSCSPYYCTLKRLYLRKSEKGVHYAGIYQIMGGADHRAKSGNDRIP